MLCIRQVVQLALPLALTLALANTTTHNKQPSVHNAITNNFQRDRAKTSIKCELNSTLITYK